MFSPDDHYYMQTALNFARRGLGRTAPNPAVGCVIVKGGHILATARTADGGRPHAEKSALAKAGDQAIGATVYVTLEPCSHEGQSGSCAMALIDAGVKRVVAACTDPNPAVSGAGLNMMREAGICVDLGLLEREAIDLNQGFFLTLAENRPFITLKTAVSADGFVSAKRGEQTWITNSLARLKAHHLRAVHDGILCGIGTIKTDDPHLTTRVDGLVHKSVRIILDSALSITEDANVVQSARDEPLWIFYETGEPAHKMALQDMGADLFQCNTRNLSSILKILSERGLTRILVEGGPHIHQSFIKAGLFDDIAVFQSPVKLGGGVPAFTDFSPDSINKALNLIVKKRIYLGDDTLTLYIRA
tara:strand:- start:851 stop:1930 length:1080 start_codon:yes stop_codon:yes gene_type:complete